MFLWSEMLEKVVTYIDRVPYFKHFIFLVMITNYVMDSSTKLAPNPLAVLHLDN